MRSRHGCRAGALLLALTLVALPIGASADEGPTDPTATTADPTLTPSPTPTPTPEPEPEPSTEPARPSPAPDARSSSRPRAAEVDEQNVREIDDAELRWGLTPESNTMSHAPGRFNFFSAGRLADPGRGGYTVTQSAWQAKSGAVAIEKSNGRSYAPATWAGLKTTAGGDPITSSSSRQFSDHQIVFSDGRGEIDPTTGDGTIQWDGDATVIYYSGFTFFYVSDPELTVDDGVGTLRATLGGFASSQEDLGVWSPLPETEVVLAELGAVDLAAEAKGFTVTPTYLQRAVTGVDQVRQGVFWGAFPQSFINFHLLGGAAGFWYSSGSAFDELKVPLPLTVSLDAEDALPPVVPPPSNGGGDDVTNDVIDPPEGTSPNTTPAANVAPPVSLRPETPLESAVAAAGGFQQVAQPVTLVASTGPASSGSDRALWWWLGIASLTLAASSVAGTLAYSAASTRR